MNKEEKQQQVQECIRMLYEMDTDVLIDLIAMLRLIAEKTRGMS